MERLAPTPAANRSRTNEKQRHHYTNGDVIEQFKQAMLDAGITPPDSIISEGQLHRFKIDGKLNGAYVLHLDGRAAGYFQDFKQDIKVTWKAQGEPKRLTDAERQVFKVLAAKKVHDRRIAEENNQHQAAIKAGFIWRNAEEASVNYPYLIRKKIKPHGARLYKNALVIPIFNSEKQLVNLQLIDPEGKKRFLAGAKKKGCFYCIGENTSKILIAEGFATAASLHEDSGYLTVIAFDAGNLELVSEAIRRLYPKAEIIICGDNDLSGVGQKAAREAALACSGKYLIPEIAGYDFNDLLSREATA